MPRGKRRDGAKGRLFGAIEAGGTKFVCGVGCAREGSVETVVIPTGEPAATFAQLRLFFESAATRHGIPIATGIASFGPLDLDPESPRYGRLTTTPKSGWRGVNMLTFVRGVLGVPAAIDTDVNAAAIAEAALCGVDPLVYVTIGTGIGIGIVAGGRPLQGQWHPEGGHVRIARHPAHGDFPGCCPFHGDCLEGLASGTAIEAAWGAPLSHLPADHIAWEVEADYLAQMCANLVLTVAPRRIVLGGGVMRQTQLFDAVRRRTFDLLAGYIPALAHRDAFDTLLTLPGCAEPPGLVGAYVLAERAAAMPKGNAQISLNGNSRQD